MSTPTTPKRQRSSDPTSSSAHFTNTPEEEQRQSPKSPRTIVANGLSNLAIQTKDSVYRNEWSPLRREHLGNGFISDAHNEETVDINMDGTKDIGVIDEEEKTLRGQDIQDPEYETNTTFQYQLDFKPPHASATPSTPPRKRISSPPPPPPHALNSPTTVSTFPLTHIPQRSPAKRTSPPHHLQRPSSPSPTPHPPTQSHAQTTLDSDDDGTGLNGIGFKPTPQIAYARKQRRKQQILDWRNRESREARERRSQRRDRYAGAGIGVGQGGGEGEVRRAVRFAC